MGVLRDLMATSIAQDQNLLKMGEAIQNRQNLFRLKELGRDFISRGDFSRQALQEFATERGMDPITTQQLGAMVEKFQGTIPTIGATRSYRAGTEDVYEAHTGGGRWQELGRGEAFKPRSPTDLETKLALALQGNENVQEALKKIGVIKEQSSERLKREKELAQFKSGLTKERQEELSKIKLQNSKDLAAYKKALDPDGNLGHADRKMIDYIYSTYMADYNKAIDPDGNLSFRDKEKIKTKFKKDMLDYAKRIDPDGDMGFEEKQRIMTRYANQHLTTDEKHYKREVEEGYSGTFGEWLKGQSPKEGKSYLLPDGTMVQSFDGGRTYLNENGENVNMPTGAVRSNYQFTGSDYNALMAKKEATAELEGRAAPDRIGDVERSARIGTGPYANLKAFVDAVVGGVGLDKLIGKNGLYQTEQQARQELKTIRQIGKGVLMNSKRWSIREQERIDELFPEPGALLRNPVTEAKKFKTLRKIMKMERHFNNQSIKTAVTPKEVERLREANNEIDRFLYIIGEDETKPQEVFDDLSPEENNLIEKYLPKE